MLSKLLKVSIAAVQLPTSAGWYSTLAKFVKQLSSLRFSRLRISFVLCSADQVSRLILAITAAAANALRHCGNRAPPTESYSPMDSYGLRSTEIPRRAPALLLFTVYTRLGEKDKSISSVGQATHQVPKLPIHYAYAQF